MTGHSATNHTRRHSALWHYYDKTQPTFLLGLTVLKGDYRFNTTLFMKINIFLIPIALLLSAIHSQAQSWQWAKSLGSPNNATTIKNIRAYTGKRALVSGSFAAPFLPLGAQILANAGQDDGFAAIVDESGQYLWAAKFGGSDRDFVVDAAAAPNGDFTVVGHFNSLSISIGGSMTLLNSGETDIFIARYKQDKTLLWTRKIGTADIDEIGSVAVDNDGNTYVSGQVFDKTTFALLNVFVRKIDAAGGLVWERKGNISSGSQPTLLALDADQNVYLSGAMFGTATFGNLSLKCDTSNAAFILKYSPSGNLLDHYFNPGLDKINGMQVQGNNLYCCAQRINGCIGWGWPLSHSKIHVLKLDANLNTLWHRTEGGAQPCQSLDIAKNIGVDDQGNAYVTGYFFSDTLDFAGQALPNLFHINYYYPQIFVLKYAAGGEARWGKALGGIHAEEGAGILVVGDDRLYLGGQFESNAVAFGAQELYNTGKLDSMYVHLRPTRYLRQTMAFLAFLDKNVGVEHPDPIIQGVTLLPNPVSEQLNLHLQVPVSTPLTLEICALDGRVLRRTAYGPQHSDLQEDLSCLAPGLYFAVLKTENARFVGKFVKQ